MKGYNTEQGYMGWWQGEYVLFSSEADYREANQMQTQAFSDARQSLNEVRWYHNKTVIL
jgi:hypothetical protein